jgi:hypothetical protein
MCGFVVSELGSGATLSDGYRTLVGHEALALTGTQRCARSLNQASSAHLSFVRRSPEIDCNGTAEGCMQPPASATGDRLQSTVLLRGRRAEDIGHAART